MLFKHPKTSENQVEIWFSDTEMGWAEKVGDNLYKLASVPLEVQFNWGDVVQGKQESDGTLRIETLKPALKYFPWKGLLFFDSSEQKSFLQQLANNCGAVMEVYRDPDVLKGLRGAALFAYTDRFSPITAAKIVGIDEPEESIPATAHA